MWSIALAAGFAQAQFFVVPAHEQLTRAAAPPAWSLGSSGMVVALPEPRIVVSTPMPPVAAAGLSITAGAAAGFAMAAALVLRSRPATLALNGNRMPRDMSPMAAVVTPRAVISMELEEGDAIRTGTCKWFDSEKGFGFISIEGETQDVFVHQSEIYAEGFRTLEEDATVEFKIQRDPKNPSKFRAVNVTGPDGAALDSDGGDRW